MNTNGNGQRGGLSGVRLVLFVIVAALVALLIAKVLSFVVHLVFAVVGYLIAFAIAVFILSWLWNRVTGGNRDGRDPSERDQYYQERDASGRRRY